MMELKEADKIKIIAEIERNLPGNARILILGYTGSRAFGWGAESYDIDVKGVIYCPKYWDTFHSGYGYDINLEEVSHFIRGIKYHYWTIFEDLCKPFYIDPVFDFDTYMTLCSSENISNHIFSIRVQVSQYKLTHDIRTALHTYRWLMCPLHFLHTGEIESDVTALLSEFPSDNLPVLIECYKTFNRSKHIFWESVDQEIDKLLYTLEKELSTRTDKFPELRFNRWEAVLMEKLSN